MSFGKYTLTPRLISYSVRSRWTERIVCWEERRRKLICSGCLAEGLRGKNITRGLESRPRLQLWLFRVQIWDYNYSAERVDFEENSLSFSLRFLLCEECLVHGL
jgi:hypothetical protein